MTEPAELDRVCACSCHKPGATTNHNAPCCDGPCKKCGANIRKGEMAQHLAERHPETKPPSRMSGSFKRPR